MKKVDCANISKELLAHVKKFLASNNLTPQLAIVQISEDDEVCSNTKSLENKCHVCGIDLIAEHLSKDSTKNHLMSCVEKLNNDSNIVCIFINSIKNLLFLNISNRYIATYKINNILK